MSPLTKLLDFVEEDFKRTQFSQLEDGGWVYAPHGNTALFLRHGFRLPDEATVGEIASRFRTDMRRAFLLFVAGIAFTVIGLHFLRWHPVLVFAIFVAVFGIPFLQFSLWWRRRCAAMERYSWPREVSWQAQERIMGPPWVAWVYCIFMVACAFVAYGYAYLHYMAGLTALAIYVAALGTAAICLAAAGPVVLRLRRLRADNQRLEAVVAQRTAQLRDLNSTLEARVKEQVAHIEKLGQLKHFFAAPVAEMILNEKEFDPAKVHRRELTAVSIDLRGFTAFSEISEPEEVIGVLRTYHAELGIQVNRCQATLEHFAGDGVMIFLNDPIAIPDHPLRALELATELRTAMSPHLAQWRSHGFDLGLGIGIATGYATIGAVGYEGRWEYAAIGTVCNLAARLCAEAKDRQVVVSQRFLSRLGDRAECEPLGEKTLKGLTKPVAMFNVLRLKEAAPAVA